MIEEPFRRTLPLEVIADAIYADVHETIYMPDWYDKSKPKIKMALNQSSVPSTSSATSVASGSASMKKGKKGSSPYI